MKIIAFILSMLFFGLSVIPCTDGTSCSDHSHTEQEHSDDSNDLNKHCSPLCFCSCCGIAFTIPTLTDKIPPQKNSIQISSHSFFFENQYNFQFKESVWHPPSV